MRGAGTALTFASRRGNVEVVKLLLERGADPDRKDTFYGSAPLVFALRKGHSGIAKALLAKMAPALARHEERARAG